MLKLKMKLDGKITSVNKTYVRGRNGGVFLAPEVKQYRRDVEPIVRAYYKASPDKYEGGLLTVNVKVYANFYTKGDDIRRLDIDNFAKGTLDAVFPPLGIDDKAVFVLKLEKKHYDKGEPYINITITETTKPDSKKSSSNKKVTKKL